MQSFMRLAAAGSATTAAFVVARRTATSATLATSVAVRHITSSPAVAAAAPVLSAANAMIKALREASGAPVSDCKAAVDEVTKAGTPTLDAAMAALRKRGAVAAGRKAGRETRHGSVAVVASDSATGALAPPNAAGDAKATAAYDTATLVEVRRLRVCAIIFDSHDQPSRPPPPPPPPPPRTRPPASPRLEDQ